MLSEGPPHNWYQISSKKVVSHTEIFFFQVKIVKTVNSHIMIGVLDRSQRKNDQSSYDTKYAATYFGYDGRKFPKGKKGQGFKQGDVIKMKVYLSLGKVKWILEGGDTE